MMTVAHACARAGRSRPQRRCAARVDVEAGVGLVEDRDLRLQHRHLQDLRALLFATGEPVIDVAAGELLLNTFSRSMLTFSLSRNSLTLIGSSRWALTAMRRKLAIDTPGTTGRVLKRQEQSGPVSAPLETSSVMSSPLKMI